MRPCDYGTPRSRDALNYGKKKTHTKNCGKKTHTNVAIEASHEQPTAPSGQDRTGQDNQSINQSINLAVYSTKLKLSSCNLPCTDIRDSPRPTELAD